MRSASFSKRAGSVIIVVGAIGLFVLGWYGTRPGPMAFAAGKTVSLDAYSGHPTGVPTDFHETDPVARGRYLTEAADCEACHTAKDGRSFAGGLAFRTPFGTMYSPNITPDKQTGIGAWSDAEFLRALHKGVGRDGKKLYPAFPYAAYTYLTDEDVLAIKAYLVTLVPVMNVPPPNELSFPFNQRWLMTFWSGLFNPNQRFKPVADQSPEWNRGAYLSEALAHCGDCHTPRNLLEALDNKNKFAGTTVDGWRAYNITSDSASGIGAWSEAELAQYLATGHAKGRGTASGPMAEAVEFSFEKLTAGDIGAMVAYVRSVPAISTADLPAPKGGSAPADPKLGVATRVDPYGKQIFEGACASCHSWTGVSPLASRATLAGSRAVNDPTATNIAQIVLSGSQRRRSDGTLVMPAFGAAYSDREIAAVANYVTARFGTVHSAITAEDVHRLRATQ
jgi:mono/diheme cytochrome c family protein